MNKTKLSLDQIRSKHHLSLLLLHGSRVTGQTHKRSDVDVAVVSKQGKPKLNLLDLINDLRISLDTKSIDVTDLTHANPLLLYATTRKARLLSGKKTALYNLQHKAFRRYSDYQKFLELEKDFITKKLNTYAVSQ